MSLRRQATSRSDEGKEPEYIVRPKSKFLKDGESPPSFLMYIKSYILVPIILTVLLACFRGGVIFIVFMWIIFILKHTYAYDDMYPKPRTATEEEIRLYALSKKKELLDLDKKYKSRLKHYDIYGMSKRCNEEYSYTMAERLKHRDNVNPRFDLFRGYEKSAKEKEASLRSEMEAKLKEAEMKYGPNWREDFKKELIENGFIRDQ